jgi:hypothetical protein
VGDVGEEVVAVSFSSPKVQSVFGPLFLVFGIEVLAKAKHDHFPNLKLEVSAGQKHLVPWNETQDPLIVFWEPILDGNPRLAHRPTNLGLRLSKKA